MLRFATYKIDTHHLNKDGKIFAKIALLNFLAASCFWAIFPLILAEKLQNQNNVGYYYSILSIVGAIISVFSTYVFCKYSKVYITKIALFSAIVLLILMNLTENIYQLGILDIPRAVCVLISNMALAIFVKDFSKKNNLALNEGRYFRYSNIGCLIGPTLGGLSAKFFGNESIFTLSSIFLIISLAYFNHQHIVIKHKHINDDLHEEGIKELFHNIYSYFKNIELIKVFLIALGLNIWWSIRSVYVPLTITNLGFSQDIIGFIITLGILPLVIFEGIAGKLAQKNGVRKYLFFGFLLISILCLLGFFVQSSYFIIAIIILANIGAAFIEPLKDTYFFEATAQNNAEKFYGIYNIAEPIGFFIGPIIASITLYFISNPYIVWGEIGLISLMFAGIALLIKKKF